MNNRDRSFTQVKIASRLWTPMANATSTRWCAMTGRCGTETHLFVAHEVTVQGCDQDQLSPMAIAAKKASQRDELHTITDQRYLSGGEILECHEASITTTVPRPAKPDRGVWQRPGRDPDPITPRRCTVEYPF